MTEDFELYDANNPEHNDTSIYEVVEWSDENDTDGRHPSSVEIGTIYDDGQRRDFTVNALYLNLSTMLLQDPTAQGIDDINSKVLRFVGKPTERLAEDRLRAYRFYRFLTKGFTPDPKALKAVRTQMIDDNKQIKAVKTVFDDDEVRALLIKKGLVQDIVLTDFERMRIEIERMVGVQ